MQYYYILFYDSFFSNWYVPLKKLLSKVAIMFISASMIMFPHIFFQLEWLKFLFVIFW